MTSLAIILLECLCCALITTGLAGLLINKKVREFLVQTISATISQAIAAYISFTQSSMPRMPHMPVDPLILLMASAVLAVVGAVTVVMLRRKTPKPPREDSVFE